MITARKVLDYSARERAAKRGGGQTASGSAFGNDEDGGVGLDAFAGAEPDPVVAAIVAEDTTAFCAAAG